MQARFVNDQHEKLKIGAAAHPVCERSGAHLQKLSSKRQNLELIQFKRHALTRSRMYALGKHARINYTLKNVDA